MVIIVSSAPRWHFGRDGLPDELVTAGLQLWLSRWYPLVAWLQLMRLFDDG